MGSIFYPAIGAILGACAFLVCRLAERGFEKKRELKISTSRTEDTAVFAAGIILGMLIMLVNSSSGQHLTAFYGFVLLCFAEIVSIMDMKYRIVPNEMIVALLAVKTAFLILLLTGRNVGPGAGIGSSLAGLAAGFVIFLLPSFFGKKVGAGDIKLAAAAGFCLGFNGLLAAVVFMGIIVLAYALLKPRIPVMAAIKETIPMGPFLSLGMMAAFILYCRGYI